MEEFKTRTEQQHEIARHYDTQLWAIPTAFFAITALELAALNDDHSFRSIWNLSIFLISGIISALFLLLFYKVHFQQLRIARALNDEEKHRLEEDRLSTYYSAPRGVTIREIQRLKNSGFDIGQAQEAFVKQSVSGSTKFLMWTSLIVNFFSRSL
jgi:hypothetical protein